MSRSTDTFAGSPMLGGHILVASIPARAASFSSPCASARKCSGRQACSCLHQSLLTVGVKLAKDCLVVAGLGFDGGIACEDVLLILDVRRDG